VSGGSAVPGPGMRRGRTERAEDFAVLCRSADRLPHDQHGPDWRDLRHRRRAIQPASRANARARLGASDQDVVFLYCGRFSAEYKMDPFPLLAVFATAFPSDAGASLVMAGDTSGRGHVEIPAIAARLGIGRRVRVVPDPSAAAKLQLYQAADVFVSLSDNLQETFGLTPGASGPVPDGRAGRRGPGRRAKAFRPGAPYPRGPANCSSSPVEPTSPHVHSG